ncbi:hypothetical protein AJ78_03514 [Emergomyces pasteurianus Ep9510]|uniref:SUZ domain-containing protein n=1 Tax=Emergomyces pasteurianus Ep9510 TaxID=1447872 RepID=A0A1J9PJS9_9EURO|nr:hypothetical protein AJ78_03514 [Emergomyces pasteurianus Ep9510]
MASKVSQPELGRPSFAKVVAMRPPTQQTHHAQIENAPDCPTPLRIDEASNAKSAPHEQPSQNLNQKAHEKMEYLNKSVQNFHINMQKDHGARSEPGDDRDDGAIKPEGAFEDDHTHLSNSSTKPTSFDSKSMASVTTFAMDEKESLRPDDSASVQAAEEDDSFSGPASGAPNSQVGSEAGGRLYRITDYGASSERVPNRARLSNTGLSEIVSPNDQNEPGLHSFPNEPDEKLLEAMNSPKDRLLILQLEEKIIAFIKNSSEQSLELPPCNAFGRLLAHKLGDYYHLTHFVDNNVTSVRLHRTPWCRLPTPLSMLQPPNANKTPPPNAPAMKIMRRSGLPGDRASGAGSTAPSSSAPSKATSEAGADGPNEEGFGSSAGATPAKDRATLSREEREAKYQEARERIFRDFPESKISDNSNSGEQSADISRSNSGSGKRKAHKQRTPHDDSFEARSQFNAYYPGAPYSSAPLPFNGMVEGSFGSQAHYYVSAASPPPVGFLHGNHVNAVYQSHGNLTSAPPQYPVAVPPHVNQNNWQPGPLQQSSPYPGFSPINQIPPMVSQQPSTRSSPGMSSYNSNSNTVPFQQQNSSTWNQPQYPAAYSPSPGQRNPSNTHWPNYHQHSMNTSQATYPYSQIPNQPFAPSHQNTPGQHPLPGSFSRPPFNPQTRSFVPGSNPQLRFPVNPPQQPGVNPAYIHPPQYPSSTSWTGSNQDISNHHSSNQPNSQTNTKINAPPSSMTHSTPSHHGPSPMMTARDSIAKWGTPAHLPPKPPPSQVPYDFDLKNKTAATIAPPQFPSTPPAPLHKQSGPLVVSGGMGHQRPRGNMATGL